MSNKMKKPFHSRHHHNNRSDTPNNMLIDSSNNRSVFINDSRGNDKFNYPSNRISTTKYTFINFFPKILYDQLKQPSNLFFVILIVIQAVPIFRIIHPIVTALPLIILLVVTFFKEAMDDYGRIKRDNKLNSQQCYTIRKGYFQLIKYEKLHVGDVIFIPQDSYVMADIFILSSNEPCGLAYIDTNKLDGESNLKLKNALTETNILEDNVDELSSFKGVITCEKPNNNIGHWEGRLLMNNYTHNIDIGQLIMRGSYIKNTLWVCGVVVYTGKETKYMMNSQQTKFKHTLIDYIFTRCVVGLVVLICSLSFLNALINCLNLNRKQNYFNFILFNLRELENYDFTFTTNKIKKLFIDFFRNVLMMSYILPLSIFLSISITKAINTYWIKVDILMTSGGVQTESNSSHLCDDLGQIEYILSDKTGTLTKNKMKFVCFSCGSMLYGCQYNNSDLQLIKDTGYLCDFSGNKFYDDDFKFFDKNLTLHISDSENHPQLKLMMLAFSMCHTVLTTKDDLEEEYDETKLVYNSQSPDEYALVTAARNFGYAFTYRTQSSITINDRGVDKIFIVLALLDFDNERKAMSAVVYERSDSDFNESCDVYLFIKGADSYIVPRLDNENAVNFEKIDDVLTNFSIMGMRTLTYAYRKLEYGFFNNWYERYSKANRQATDNRHKRLRSLYEEVECNLVYLGVTGIEDYLQDKVYDTVSDLLDEGIKIWMVTGDKEETARNVAYNCNIITHIDKYLAVIDGSTKNEVKQQLEHLDNMFSNAHMRAEDEIKHSPLGAFSNSINGPIGLSRDGSLLDSIDDVDTSMPISLIVHGQALTHALKPTNSDLFVRVACSCLTVIFCRSAPLQKAKIAKLLRQNGKVVLSVGDGANDVPMLKAANIGVGISGNEGNQACNESDYAINEFRFLSRLLLVHGRLCYMRICKFLLFFLYKNYMLSLVPFFFAVYNRFEPTALFDVKYLFWYNILFTNFPIMMLAIFESDIKNGQLNRPGLYFWGRKQILLNYHKFIMNIFRGFLNSFIIFAIPWYSFKGVAFSDGQIMGSLEMMRLIYGHVVILNVTIAIALKTKHWNVLTFVCIFGSIISYYIFLIICYLLNFTGYDISLMFTSPIIMLTVLLTVAVTILPELFIVKFYPFLKYKIEDLILSNFRTCHIFKFNVFYRIWQSIQCRRKIYEQHVESNIDENVRLQENVDVVPHIGPRSSITRRRMNKTSVSYPFSKNLGQQLHSKSIAALNNHGYAFDQQTGFGNLITRGISVVDQDNFKNQKSHRKCISSISHQIRKDKQFNS